MSTISRLLLLFGFVVSVLQFFPSVSFAAGSVVINEFLPAPSSGNPEWVELYNPTSSTIDLSDYYFDDDTSFDSDAGSSTKVALSGLLNPQASCYIDLSSFLNNNGDTATILKTDGSVTDSYQYTQTTQDKSYARVPDGEQWQANQIPTKSSSRCADLAPTPLPPTPTVTPTLITEPSSPPTPSPTTQPSSTPRPPSPSGIPTAPSSISSTPTSIEGSVLASTNNITQSNPDSSPTLGASLPESHAWQTRLPLILILSGTGLVIGFGVPLLIGEFRTWRKTV